ncbi:aminotransferase class III-fold pyridoxal phosphate-dependent enzyme [Streptomyces sp. SID8361]|uniref:aspartate aminotransferase family protein n=1 Tax=Streptomyces sp. MnatMP-M27 TaxID=1839768 RepID=UPI00081D6639|nr:aspartate aminotransferase family protein [Streptomyces sp. MnatMP-M27]MYU10062.1 aminotransferase class III-fold pyridoxal phosphate-dependent enzyme [Streptomyces sp. SID8361]SCF67963.1 glutamate-1-semialdehyde 2,1-aminomutase [Streptomyces sp. MnatMP-M27]
MTSRTRAESVLPGGSINDFEQDAESSIIVSRAAGTSVWDSSGCRYVDFLLGSGPMVLGHGHPVVTQKVTDQLAKGTSYYLPNGPAIELAGLICDLVPCAESVRFCGDGSEAVFYALRLARAFTGRRLVLKFEGGFHGHSDYAMQSFAPVSGPRYPEPEPDSDGIPGAVTDTVIVVPFNDLAAVEHAAKAFGRDLAAILVEPIQRAIEPVDGFLQGLRRVCDETGTLLIFDEVVTGFRIDLGGAQEVYGVTPDLCSLGKSMSGGIPGGACVAGRSDVLDLVVASRPIAKRVYVSGTFNGNALSCAGGLAALEVLRDTGGCDVINQRGDRLRTGLKKAINQSGLVGDVIGPAAFPEVVIGREGVINYREYVDSDRPAALAFGAGLLARGFLVRPGTKLYVSAVHSEAEIDGLISAATETLAEMAEASSSSTTRLARTPA